MEKKGNIILIVVLSLLVIALGGYIAYDKVLSQKQSIINTNNETTTNTQDNNGIENTKKVYTKGEKITLSDKSTWLVLSDSDETEEVVKLMNVNDFIFYGSPCSEQKEYIYCDNLSNDDHDALMYEFFSSKATYKGSNIERIVNSYESKVPAKLKEVDGYKIRLLSINDIFEYDNNWEKQDENMYKYIGSKLEESFLGAWTMDTVGNKCYGQVQENGRCSGNTGVFFVANQTYNYETQNIEGTYLTGGASGLSQVKPVIYAYKNSI